MVDVPTKAELADGGGSNLIGFQQAGNGAVTRTQQQKDRDVLSVKDFGAAMDGASDDTAAFNLATSAAEVFSTALYRRVDIPSGTTVLGGGDSTVYLRKGQTLAGGGFGSTVLDLTAAFGNSVPTITFGERSNGTLDPGGQAIEVSGLTLLGSPTSHGCIDTNGAAGWTIHNTFFSSPGVGIHATGGDGLIYACLFDDGLNGIVLSGGNTKVSNCLFYLANQQITLNSGAYDTIITDCQFEYPEIYAIVFNTGATGLKNIQIRGCNFIQNEQFNGSHAIHIASSGADAKISGCTFRNLAGAGVAYGTGLGNTLVIEGCIFDGLKTLADYAQSTTMEGVQASNMNVIIRNCVFRNLPGQPITFGGAEVSTLLVQDCTFSGNTGGTTDVSITNPQPTSKVTILNCRSDRMLVNSQGTVPVFAPDIAVGQVTLVAGTATVSNALVRNSSKIHGWRQTDGGTVGASYSITRNAGSSFTITSRNGTGAAQAADTSVLNYTVELAGT